jgi:hypothetical protein
MGAVIGAPSSAPTPSPAPSSEMDLLMGLDASPRPAASAAVVPDLLGGFNQLSVVGASPGSQSSGMVMDAQISGAPPTLFGTGTGMGAGIGPGAPLGVAPGGGQMGGMGGMSAGAASSIPAHLRDRTPKKKSDPFADLLR